MKKTILVLSRKDNRPTFDSAATVLKGMTLIDSKCEYVEANYENLIFIYDGKTLTVTDYISGKDISTFDAILFIGWFKSKTLEDVARSVAYYARAHNIPFVNSEALLGRSFTKLTQGVVGVLHDAVRVIPFVFSMDPRLLKKIIKSSDFLGRKFILKGITASRGDDNYLIESEEKLDDVLSKNYSPSKYFIAQKHISNKGDYRILLINGDTKMIIYRQGSDKTHLNNVSRGDSAMLIPVSQMPQEILNGAARISSLLNREISGVDFIKDGSTEEYYFLESNNMPQISTGKFVSDKLRIIDQFLLEISNDNRE